MSVRNQSNPKRALVFGHADGDGYLAAEVSRENLVEEGWIVDDVVVDPKKTGNYNFWNGHFLDWDFADVELVVTVDLAFNPKVPMQSCDSLSHHASEFPSTRFLIIDHHPLPSGDWLPENVTLVQTDSVYNCCYGAPNDLMVVASICDKDEEPVGNLILPSHRILAEGINRAAADKKGVGGAKLVSILRNKEWAWVFALGTEPATSHRTYFGSRTGSSIPSAALEIASGSGKGSLP